MRGGGGRTQGTGEMGGGVRWGGGGGGRPRGTGAELEGPRRAERGGGGGAWGGSGQKLVDLSPENPEPSGVLSAKPGVGQGIAFRASTVARN